MSGYNRIRGQVLSTASLGRDKRIRGRKLQEIRKAHFSQHPLCEECQRKGIIRLATELDHRIALTNGGEDFDVAPDQKCGLCHDCHDAKTAIDMGYKPRLAISIDGWPIE